ncbi:MAG: hypothetical protein H8Z69_01705 [Nanohaloarchaea archaeon]|nr:hypothetical protein [Candidatus Nanohaloarchaea archaeon]
MTPEELCDLIEEGDPERIELVQHVFERAKRRNVDVSNLKEKILSCEFEEVRENNQGDPNFKYSYRVKIQLKQNLVEVPVYFNVPGTKILVKSIWRA